MTNFTFKRRNRLQDDHTKLFFDHSLKVENDQIIYLCSWKGASMVHKKNERILLKQVVITDTGAEGKAVGRAGDKVVFVPFAAPGDMVDVEIRKRRKSYYEGVVTEFHHRSGLRTEPRCEHFGVCGGCRWQHLDYQAQLLFKQKQVEDSLRRIGKLELPPIRPILASGNVYHYRNKLEYTFSNRGWRTQFNKQEDTEARELNALGFHIPGLFDRVLDIRHCYLQAAPSDEIRRAVKQYALDHRLTFYDVKTWTGLLRNLIIRNTSTGELMVILVVRYHDSSAIEGICEMLSATFPQITSLMYVINEKRNDVISDLEICLYRGKPFMIERIDGLEFKIGPASFFQTNSYQALELYRTVRDFAGLQGKELVYDLYSGTGTIANYLAGRASQVIGIEYVPAAVQDAIENSARNGINNTRFFAGDIARILSDAFVRETGTPNVVITDPPRAGMHKDVILQILAMDPETIIYVSCNPATQARDVALLSKKYQVAEVQSVDMFPHTHHVENVMKLIRRNIPV